MTNQHPITPPPELVEQLRNSPGTWLKKITNAYQSGADMELEVCCEWLERNYNYPRAGHPLRAARRPKPPSLAKRALHILGTHGDLSCAEHDTIRRALDALDD